MAPRELAVILPEVNTLRCFNDDDFSDVLAAMFLSHNNLYLYKNRSKLCYLIKIYLTDFLHINEIISDLHSISDILSNFFYF